VDFSEARDLFGIIFQFWGPNCKIRDCGLILKKWRGLSAKYQKLEISRNCFSKGKLVDQVHKFMDRGRHQSMMDRGQGLGGRLTENGQNGTPVRGTSPRCRKKGEGTAVSLTGCKRGQRRDENSRASVGKNRRRRRSVRAVLGHGEKRREMGRGPMKLEVCALPFIGAGEGHAGARRGETAGGNGLSAIDGGWLNEGLRGGLKRGIKAGSEDLAWQLKVGGRVAQGDRRRRGEAATGRPAWGRG
jgi:hypothetical protein